MKVLVSQSCPILAVLWTVVRQAPLSMEFFRQEYWSYLPFLSPGDLPHPGIKPWSPALQGDSLPSEPPGKPLSNALNETQFSTLRSCVFFSSGQFGLPVKGPRVAFPPSPELGPWYKQGPLVPICLPRESRQVWVSLSWFSDLPVTG